MLIRQKLLFAFLPALLLPLLVATFYIWLLQAQQERTHSSRSMQIMAHRIHDGVAAQVRHGQVELSQLLRTPTFTDFITEPSNPAYRQVIERQITAYAEAHPEYGPPGLVVRLAGSASEPDHHGPEPEWLRQVLRQPSGQVVVLPAGIMQADWAGPVLAVHFTSEAEPTAANSLTRVILTLPLKITLRDMDASPDVQLREPIVWLLDSQRELIDGSPTALKPWRSSPEEIDALLEAARTTDLARLRVDEGALLGIAKTSEAGLTIAIFQAEALVMATTRRLEWILGIAWLASGLISYFGLGRLVQNVIVKPLLSLTQATRAFGRGDRGEALLEASRNDEIGALTHALEDVRRHLRESSAEAHRLINADALTGLPNRRYMQQRLDEEIARRRRNGGGLFAVMFIDLDNFKSINDSMGHKAGDRMVIKVAQRLVQAIRAYDSIAIGVEPSPEDESTAFVARLGGDEFLLLVNDLKDSDDAARVARRLYEVFDEPISIDALQINVSMSVGIVCYPGNGETAEQLIKNADVAMYSAKQAGKNQFRFYQGSMEKSARRSLELESGLRRAISANLLSIHYQPQYCLKTGALTGAEALVRWWDSERACYISPGEFVPIAESCGLIHELGNWILVNGLHQLAEWNSEGLRLQRLSLNLSTHQVESEGLAARILDLAQGLGIQANQLEFELTETAIFRHREIASRNLETLRAAGARLSLDDFGTGFSSLAWVRYCKVDAVKIDQSFVRNIYSNTTHQAVVSSVVELCRRLDLDIVAEGIETQQELQAIRGLGCTLAQGYLLGRPISVEEFTEQVLRLAATAPEGYLRAEAR